MSWDVCIIKSSKDYSSIDDIPKNPPPLGARPYVHEAVSDIYPATDWSDPGWGAFACSIGSIEFNVGSDPVISMMLHVRAGDEIVDSILVLCEKYDWSAIDTSTGDFIRDKKDAGSSLQKWRSYRDSVLKM